MFEVGYQPCINFNGKKDMFGLTNRHECMRCISKEGTVSFCENCYTDHHENGYESCEHDRCPSKENCLRLLIKTEVSDGI